jgi:BTB/POZ domain
MHYVSRDLISKFPTSRLYHAVQRWEEHRMKTAKEQEAAPASDFNDKYLFVDRNSHQFEYVLDFMWHGSVKLPVTIPKQPFLKT